MFNIGGDSLLWFIMIGIAAGWLAGQITRGGGFGLVGDLAVGIVGASVGGFLANLFGLHTYGVVGAIFTATVGAVVLLMIYGFFSREITDPPHSARSMLRSRQYLKTEQHESEQMYETLHPIDGVSGNDYCRGERGRSSV